MYNCGVKNGLYEEWSQDGELIKSINYKDGKEDNIHKNISHVNRNIILTRNGTNTVVFDY